jgi:hypothetical protein
MKFREKYRTTKKIDKNKVITIEEKKNVHSDIKDVSKKVIKTIHQSGNGFLEKQQKIEKIKNIVLADDINNTSISRLKKFINFTI